MKSRLPWIETSPWPPGQSSDVMSDGRFGSVFYHQDDFETFRDEALLPMLERSPARETLDAVLVRLFDGLAGGGPGNV
jgi:hypothetical protein